MYNGASFDIILLDGQAVGRFYLHRREHEWRIVDIALLPDARAQGIGKHILERVLSDASLAGRAVSIHVERYNRALSLYRRLGFVVVNESHPVYYLMQCPPASK